MTATTPASPPFTGTLLTPGSPGYDERRRVWNGAIDRRPAFIACCRTPGDVTAALALARRHDLAVAIRGGGHSIPGWSVCDGGLVIDLTAMKSVTIDPVRRTAVVQPGVTWGEFDAAAQAHGLATPGGEVSHTGVAGLTLGGGIGWLSRMHGLTCDNLLAVDLVSVDGELRRVDDASDPELMWGLRGGGGNFGIVTSFTFRLHPVGPVYGGPVLFPADRAIDVLRLYRELGAQAPRELSLVAVLITAPPAPHLPRECWGRQLAGFSAAWIGDAGEGERALAPLRTELGRPAVDLLGVLPYTALQQAVDAGVPWGLRSYVKSDFLGELDDAAVEAMAEAAAGRHHPLSHVLLRRLGGAIADRSVEATAFAHRQATSMSTMVAAWDRRDDPAPETAWARHTWARLTALKGRMDPDNVLRHDQNVPPA